MGIDRKAFYALATAMLFGPTGCIVQPNQPSAVTPANTAAQPEDDNGCIRWDPTGECTQWGLKPSADGCLDMAPSGECLQWEDYGAYGPANECVDWDPSGECVQWDDYAAYEPANECIAWDPTGECIDWMPARW